MSAPESWGRISRSKHLVRPVYWSTDPLPPAGSRTMLPFGLGRSYGDSCLNDNGLLLLTTPLNRILALDEEKGIIRCEAGISLDEVLRIIVPKGWFLPTTPGTKFVTVGGAIANDIHGKNHHRAGTFGCHVTQFELLRSTGERLLCSPDCNSEWFCSTIGGLGLTGLITWAEFRLRRIANAMIEMESIKFRSLDEFLALSMESDHGFEYTVSWLDCAAKGSSLGRGLYMRGNHAGFATKGLEPHSAPWITIPIEFPNLMLNRYSIKAFNSLYYARQLSRKARAIVHYNGFFYPLDAINRWNRIYGRRGLFQYQFVLPFSTDQNPIREILSRIARSGEGSFLAVLKILGEAKSPGFLSFPRPGLTLALDFPNRGNKTLKLMETLDRVVLDAGGSFYPAKDARMSPEAFESSYPQWRVMEKYRDPSFSSGFWRRVTRGN